MSVYKRLVFHFYADKKYKENRAIKIHLKCLKEYSHIFDTAIFCVALDDINDNELYKNVTKDIVDCGFKDIHIKLVQNDAYREARTFYEEIVKKIDTLDGMTFFGHTKGYTNYIKMPNGSTIESLDTWLTGLYYLSLNNIKEAEENLFDNHYLNYFYGSFLTYCKEDLYGNDFILYSGTFFWVNCLALTKKFKMPLLDDLAYAERFISNFLNKDDFFNKVQQTCGSLNRYMSFITNWYYFANKYIGDYFENKSDYKKYLDFKENILYGI